MLCWVGFEKLFNNNMFGVVTHLLLVSEVTSESEINTYSGNHSTKRSTNIPIFKGLRFVSHRAGNMAERLKYFAADPKIWVEVLLWNDV